ncbi:hypothetical protein CRUP_015378 [Coryphaenoides rupestris]|nr:hypothetical protein CRUP_015378 [Coryphaenoides rupestris]
MTGAELEDDIPLGERKTVTDFCYLLDKSKQLFNGLRDLPQYGHKQWQSYFGRTFDVYTKLWKFQQQHRQVLDSRYGLKRWQIGEVASKIGQLLRTSETSYLNEAFSFYSAIRQRSYYFQVNKEDRPELVVKKLRYYARYIVVCLLLNKMDLVKVLVKELSEEIEDYTQRFNTEDQLEWNLVLQEVAAFVEADPVMVVNDNNVVVVNSNRLQEGCVPPLEQGMVVGQLVLADALIIGNCNNQVKFSELTIDMFRMLQALEREPVNLATQTSKQGTLEPNEKPAKRENPHKYLLYKPTFSQLFTFLSASFKNFTNLFGQPLVCLLSPTSYPKSVQDQTQRGSLFTLFLYCPLLAFFSVCGLSSVRRGLWERAQEFLRKDTVESSLLQKHVLELAAMLDVQNLFWDDPLEGY